MQIKHGMIDFEYRKRLCLFGERIQIGICYLNSVKRSALKANSRGIGRYTVIDAFRHPPKKHLARQSHLYDGRRRVRGCHPRRVRKKAMHFELFLLCPQSIVLVKERRVLSVRPERHCYFTRGSLIGHTQHIDQKREQGFSKLLTKKCSCFACAVIVTQITFSLDMENEDFNLLSYSQLYFNVGNQRYNVVMQN